MWASLRDSSLLAFLQCLYFSYVFLFYTNSIDLLIALERRQMAPPEIEASNPFFLLVQSRYCFQMSPLRFLRYDEVVIRCEGSTGPNFIPVFFIFTMHASLFCNHSFFFYKRINKYILIGIAKIRTTILLSLYWCINPQGHRALLKLKVCIKNGTSV